MNKISINKFNNIESNYKKVKNGEHINKGEPFFRIINNSDIYSLIEVNKDKVEKFWIKETVFIKNGYKSNSKIFKARIIDIIDLNETSFIIIEFNKFINEWLNLRKKEIKFIKNIYEGLIIPNTAVLPTSDGYKVVKVDSNNNFTLKSIDIVFSNEKHMIVEGLQLGDEILLNPAKSNFEINKKQGGNNDE